MKIYLNEASGISAKCKLKLVRLVQKHFMVDLPHDNYLNIDIKILENNESNRVKKIKIGKGGGNIFSKYV